MSKEKNKKNKKKKNRIDDNKYNAENEIIIGVTTKPKEKVRVEEKATRTKLKNNKSKTNINRKQKKNSGQAKNKKRIKEKIKEEEIRKINRRKTITSIVIIFCILSAGVIYFLTTSMFNIVTINVFGNDKNSVDTYISLSGINVEQTNIFACTGTNIEKRIKENPYVESVKIKKKLPNIIELYIEERVVAYQVKYLKSYIYISEQGYILEINEQKQNVPIIEGIVTIQDDIQLGKRLINEDLLKLDTILKIVNYMEYNNIPEERLTTINAQDISNYILEFKKENKTVYIGDSSRITEKMTAVVRILEAEKGKKGKIYATEDALKRNRIYFSEEK